MLGTAIGSIGTIEIKTKKQKNRSDQPSDTLQARKKFRCGNKNTVKCNTHDR